MSHPVGWVSPGLGKVPLSDFVDRDTIIWKGESVEFDISISCMSAQSSWDRTMGKKHRSLIFFFSRDRSYFI